MMLIQADSDISNYSMTSMYVVTCAYSIEIEMICWYATEEYKRFMLNSVCHSNAVES